MRDKKWRTIMTFMVLILEVIIILLATFYFVFKKEDSAFLEKKSMEENNNVTKEKDVKKKIKKPDKTADKTDKSDETDKTNNEASNESNNTAKNENNNIKEPENKEIFAIQNISDEIFKRIEGKSYKSDCNIPLEDLKYLKLSYYGFDGETHIGEMIVNAMIAEDTLHVFQELYEANYPIERMELVDEFDADDIASMEANNTSAFNFRYIDGTTKYSNHAMGFAIDINPLYNPYVRNRDGEDDVLPVTAKAYADRSTDCLYYIKEDDICYQIFTKCGFSWGGEWNNSKDYQHFEKIIEN